MTSYVRNWAWYEKNVFQNHSFIAFNNFNNDQLFEKTKFKDLKGQLSSKITEKLLIDVFELRHMSETGHGNIFIIILLMCATTSTMKFFF